MITRNLWLTTRNPLVRNPPVPIDLKTLTDVPGKEGLKKTVYNKLNTKVNSLERKIPDAITLIHKNHYNANKQNLEKTIGNFENEVPDISGLVTLH